MKMSVVKNEGNELIVDFETSDYTIPDLIASQLQQNDDVEFAGVAKEHPEVGRPRLVIRTNKKNPRAALEKALKQLDETISELKASIPAKGK